MKLIGKLFFLFTLTTILELYLLMQLTKVTNIWVTIALTIFSGMLGAYLAKREGLRALAQLGSAARLEQEPAGAVIDSVLILIGAAFLITPGVLTDLIGLMLMIPAVRKPAVNFLKRYLWKVFNKQLQSGSIQFFSGGMDPRQESGSRPFRHDSGEVIDIKAER